MNPRMSLHRASAGNPVRPRKWRLMTVIGGSLALAGAASLTGASAAHAGADSSTITLLSVTKARTKIPDGVIVTDVDKNSRGIIIGADSRICHVYGPVAKPQCAVTIDLGHGDLFFAVTATKAGVSGRLAGGTGRYAGSSGTMVVTDLSATRARLVITLTN
jgi:hypothetical protein